MFPTAVFGPTDAAAKQRVVGLVQLLEAMPEMAP